MKVLTTLGMFAVPVTAETTVGEIRQKVQAGDLYKRARSVELMHFGLNLAAT